MRPYNLDATPPTGDVFAGMLECIVEEAELRDSSTGKAMAHLHFVTTDGNEVGYQGKHNHAYLVIGSDADPQAEDPVTFGRQATFGLKQLRDIWVATRYPRTNDLDADIPGLKGYRLLINFTPDIDKETKEVRTRARGFFPVGARPLNVRDVNPETGKMGPPVMAGSTPPVATASAAPETGNGQTPPAPATTPPTPQGQAVPPNPTTTGQTDIPF